MSRGMLLIRHAHREGGLLPHADVPISERGRLQTVDLGRMLARHCSPDVIVSSPVLRCRETAQALASEVGLSHVSLSRTLGDPGVLVAQEALVEKQLSSNLLTFHSYFCGAVVPGMRCQKDAFELLFSDLACHRGLVLGISHDWIVATIARQVGITFPKIIPDFLDGVWIPPVRSAYSEAPQQFQPFLLQFQ
jgi:phosphohistidine phosphatase SixA